jgi:hypothetical protein
MTGVIASRWLGLKVEARYIGLPVVVTWSRK